MPRSFSLDDLIALNDEIRALANAGIPLDRGLVALSNDLPRRLSRQAAAIGKSLEEGQSLLEALDHAVSIPAAYRAAIQAGLQSGQLAAALQGIAGTSRRAAEIGRVTAVSLLYPIVVFGVASVVFAFSLQFSAPVVERIYDEFEIAKPAWYGAQMAISHSIAPLLPWIWGAVSILALFGWIMSLRPSALHGSGRGWLPGASRLIREGRLATFADLLALLLKQQVPLAESIQLAAEATGDSQLSKAATAFSEELRAGVSPPRVPDGFPPLLGWLLVSGCSSKSLVKSLHNSAASHRRRAVECGKWVAIYFPVILSAGLGGIVTLIYVMLVLGPFYYIIRSLG